MKVLALTQARTGSTRLSNKVLKKINGDTLLNIHIKRILESKKIDKLIIATTTLPDDEAIVNIASKNNISYYRGSNDNVLDRFYQAAKKYKPKWIVRLTSDCPLIDCKLIDKIINTAIEKDVDYCSNTLNPTYPDGFDVEVLKFNALEKAWKEAELKSDKEHVTPYIHRNSTYAGVNMFSSYSFENFKNFGHVRLTVDEALDFKVINIIIKKLGVNKGWIVYADYYLSNKNIYSLNEKIKRNEGYDKSLKENKLN